MTSGNVLDRLRAAGIEVPPAPVPVGLYVPAVRVGSLVYTSGQLPVRGGILMAEGAVDVAVSIDMAIECARLCAVNCLVAASTVCDPGAWAHPVKLVGYVASSPEFTRHPAIIDGASEVLSIAFGQDGSHAREAVGVASLPLAAPVEVSLVLAVV